MAYPSDLVRTKNWGSEILTDSDLEGQLDLIINWVMAAFHATTGHTHSGSGNNGPLLSSSAVTTTFGDGFTTVTAASGDYVMVASDVSDSNKTKKALVSDIVTLAAPVAATQAEQETGSSTTVMVTPGRQQYHPSAAKAWCHFDGTTTGTNAPTSGYNVTSVTRNSAGNYTVNFTTAMSGTSYCIIAMAGALSGNANSCHPSTLLTTSATFLCQDSGGSSQDTSSVMFLAFGDQ